MHMRCERKMDCWFTEQHSCVVSQCDGTTGHCDQHRHKSGHDLLLSTTKEAAFVVHVKQVAACRYGYTRRKTVGLAGERLSS